MRSVYSEFAENDLWLIKEAEWNKPIQSIRETQFALGNGYMGSRGILEEIPYDSKPGTYLAGIYDTLTAQVSELVNFPNAMNFKFSVEGEKLDVSTMDVIHHRRILNMKKALVLRNTLYHSSKKHRYHYQSLRFLSMHNNKKVGVLQIILTPMDKDCELDIETNIDTAVYNSGTLTEGRKKHFRVKELGQKSNAGYLVVETFEKKHEVVFWSGFYYEYEGKKIYAKDNIFSIKVKKGKPIKFTKVFHISHEPAGKPRSRHKENAFREFAKAFHSDFRALLGDHIKEWEKLWDNSDVMIKGTANLQVNMRFNIYHMLLCANFDNGFSSIGARTLSGEGYRGHIFWDAELFLLPFFLYTNPQVAKNMLLYRYRRLDQAREIAEKLGYKGAMFPWESADTGYDETPTWAKDINGEIVKIYTNQYEQHITMDIAYAVWSYYNATGDEEFMERYGYEMLFETARFCASRLDYNGRAGYYEVKNVIGPDEFHIKVNNNAFTNMMVKWNLLESAHLLGGLKKSRPALYRDLKKKIALKDTEAKKWRELAGKIKKLKIDRNKIIEQFDGYFKLKNVRFKEMDENGIPILPKTVGTNDMGKTQLIKQPDVVMMLYLLSDFFTEEVMKENYRFYIKKTAHKSSLSPSIDALIACRAGDLFRAYHLFNVTLRADISNLYRNTHEGAHAASLGGTFQSLIFGFAGLKVSKHGLSIDPTMPRTWESLVFNFHWKGRVINFEITNTLVKLKVKSKKAEKEALTVTIFGQKQVVKGGKTFTFIRETKQSVGEFFY